MELNYDSKLDRRRDPRGPFATKKVYVHGIAEPQVLPFEEWEKLPSDIKLDISFEDEDLIVVNKPKGMVVHPGANNYENTSPSQT